VYKEQEGIDGDRIVADARKYGFAILFTFFNYWGQHAAFWGQQTLTSGETKALQRYAQYLIDRYGAYIDIWEVVNEGNATAAWYAALIPYLKANDPYQHDVTSSTVYALDQTAWDAGVTLNMMHWYAPITEDHADQWTYDNILSWKADGAVSNTIVGETGNCCSVCNYGPPGFRLRNWAAFFAEAILVYWDDATTKSACGGANTNYYIGDEERAFAKVLQDFNKDFDPRAEIANDFTIQGAGVKGHGLSGPSDYALYLVAQNHTVATSGVKVTVIPQSAGHATWIDPSTGSVLAELDVLSGTQTLDVPTFTTDVALKIHGG
jgi:hypothetical protein